MEILARLQNQANQIKQIHLRDLLSQRERNQVCTANFENILFDYSHSKVCQTTLDLLGEYAISTGLFDKIRAMYEGQHINTTENRAVLHVLLRAQESQHPQFPEVLQIRERIKEFANKVRNGEILGVTGKPLFNILCIGIGGSYLGPEFVAEALKTEPNCMRESIGRNLRFLANVDPVDFLRATHELDPEETLVVIISKTFTTAETMMNARKATAWLTSHITSHPSEKVIEHHVCAVSSNLQKTKEFGIQDERVFGFWDWVGGRYSVTSAVGLVPLYLHYGAQIDLFLQGANSIDRLFLEKANLNQWKENIPLLMGLLGWWNTQFLEYASRAVLPYSQALVRFAAHIQQLDMESNGKQCKKDGTPVEVSGPIVFGEPGTNGQHSFYQLMHQGRIVQSEFIGFCQSHSSDSEAHNELMSNFFAQPDALALGKTTEELRKENCPDALIPHKMFKGDRPSFSLLFPALTVSACGQLLALYEHRVAVEGFLWDLNSFDQFGVELGKTLATKVKQAIASETFEGHPSENLLLHYINHR
mmetsp:Transcript_30708/g.30359  ORF Transcript_30708/g.30359 Transcript_30708/m.30359 type:complete len:533 (+) Transcript_30708:19-1617(+)